MDVEIATALLPAKARRCRERRLWLKTSISYERLPFGPVRTDAIAMELSCGEVGELVAQHFFDEVARGFVEVGRKAD